MELSWSSFILEIINFLVLIWILKHLFYTPIKEAITQRKQAILDALDKAQKLHDEALALQAKYENRLTEWETEKAEKQKEFQQSFEEWKSRELANFEKTIEKEKEKINSREMQRIASTIEANTRESMDVAAHFATRFLKYFADTELERKIIDKVIDDLSHLTDEKLKSLKDNMQGYSEVTVQSTYPISENQKQNLIQIIKKISHSPMNIVFSQDANLISGLNIQLGSLYLQANLRDELKFFTEIEKEHA